MNRFFEKHGYYAIQTIGIFLGENTDPNKIRRDRYLAIKADGLAEGGPELSYAAINISPWALSIHAGKFNQTSFIFHVIHPDGTIHSELWEITDSNLRFHLEKNPFVKSGSLQSIKNFLAILAQTHAELLLSSYVKISP